MIMSPLNEVAAIQIISGLVKISFSTVNQVMLSEVGLLHLLFVICSNKCKTKLSLKYISQYSILHNTFPTNLYFEFVLLYGMKERGQIDII